MGDQKMIRTIYLLLLLLILVACTTPTTSEAIVETAVPPNPTPQPTATTSTGSVQATAPTATPEATPTPTAAEQANQLLLNNGRFTTLLDNLTQEIGRDLSDAEQAQVLALARALWLPDQLDASDWLPDPTGVTLHWRPALDGREGPVVRVVEAQPDSPYAAGAVIFWQAERLLTLTPGQTGHNIEFIPITKNGESFSAWGERDPEGQVIRFVDPQPDSPHFLKWVSPQDLSEDGSFSIFLVQEIDQSGQTNGDEFWWTNSGEEVRIDAAPDGRDLMDYTQTANRSLDSRTIDGQEYLVIIDAAGINTEHRYHHDTGEWEVFEISAIDVYQEALNFINQSETLFNTPLIQETRLNFKATPLYRAGTGNLWAFLTDTSGVENGMQYFEDELRRHNGGKLELPIYNPDTR
jgi:hypothetical protein